MLILLLSAALMAEASAPAPAATDRAPKPRPKTEIRLPAAQVVGVVPQGKDDEIVCRKEQLLGSRMAKTVCEQKSIADERRHLDQEAVRHIQDLSKGRY